MTMTMTMTMTMAIIGLLSTALVGLPLAWRLRVSESREALVGTSLLCGSLMISLAMWLLSILRFPWSVTSILTSSLLASLTLAFAMPRVYRHPRTARVATAGVNVDRWTGITLDIVLLVMVIAQVAYVTVSEPWEWDFIGIWGVKGARFFEAGGIDWAFLADPDNSYAHGDYPVLLPLNAAWLATIAGAWSGKTAALLGSVFAGAALMVVRGVTRDLSGSWFLTAVMSIALFRPLFDTPVGLADGPLAAFAISAIALLTLQLLSSDASSTLPWFLIGAATLTKNEGLTLALATVGLYWFWSRRSVLRGGLIVATIALTWQITRIVNGIDGDLFAGDALTRIAINVGAVFSELISTAPGHPFVWIAAILALGLSGRSVRSFSFPLVVAATQILFYSAAYLISPHEIAWHVDTSWARLTLHVLPMVVFAAVLAIGTKNVEQMSSSQQSV